MWPEVAKIPSSYEWSMLFSASVDINSVFGLKIPLLSSPSSNSCYLKLLTDQMHIFLSAPEERKNELVAFIWAGLEYVKPHTAPECPINLWVQTFECMFHTIISPSADPDTTSIKLFVFLAIQVIPSEWSSRAFKNGFENIFSILEEFRAH